MVHFSTSLKTTIMVEEIPSMLKSLNNAQAIKDKVEHAEQVYVQAQQHKVPEMRYQLTKAEKMIVTLSDLKSSTAPLHKTKALIQRLEQECVRLKQEIYKYTAPQLFEKFKEKSLQGCHFINETVKQQGVIKAAAMEAVPNAIVSLISDPITVQKENTNAWQKETVLNSLDDDERDLVHFDKEGVEEAITNEDTETNSKYLATRFEDPIAQLDRDKLIGIHANLLNIKRLHLIDDEIAFAASSSAVKPGTMTLKPFCQVCALPLFCTINQSKLVCKNCSAMQDYTESQTLSLAFNIDSDWQHNVYERYTHLMDIIEPFRPRKKAVIPVKVYDEIRALMRQNRGDNSRSLTFAKVQNYLEHLGYRDLYEHKYQITMEMNGEWLPLLNEQTEFLIVRTFLMMQSSFESAKTAKSLFESTKKSKRSSFLKYEFVTFHICRLLGFHQFCPFLKLLSVSTRHRRQLKLLRVICKDLGWNYVPQLW
jgi:hypothetical protein